MNLVELATELEYVPKDQLAQLSQDPSSRYPQYLVLSEIQRRTANEKAYAAARPQPTTTVAEEVVGEFVQPMSLQAGMPSESAPTDVFSSESMSVPASAPMQQPMMMANGGLTSYAQGGRARASINRSFETPFLDNIKELAADRYYDEEGDFNYLTALGDAAIAIPVGGAAIGGLRLLGKGAQLLGRTIKGQDVGSKAGRGLQSLFTRPTTAAQRQRQVDAAKKKFGLSPGQTKGTDLVPVTSRTFSPAKTLKTIGYPTGAAVAISRALDGEDEPETIKDLQELKTGLGGVTAEKPKKEIDYDLVGLGGLIMGARDMSEFGKGLSEFAASSSKRKLEKEALATQQELQKAQAAKYRADIKSKSFDELQAEIQLISQGGQDGTIDLTSPVVQNYLQSLFEALAQRRGGTLQDDILKQQQAS